MNNEWIHLKLNQEVELKGMELVGTIKAIEGKWFTIEIDDKYFGKFEFSELKPMESEDE